MRESSASSWLSNSARAILLGLLAVGPIPAATAWDLSPKANQESYGFEIGPAISLLLPSANVSQDEIGLNVGLSFITKTTPTFGVGVDVAYHYWPVSTEFKEGFSEAFRDQSWSILTLGEGTWGLQVLHLGAHGRFAPPSTRGVRPWLQFGAGLYRVDPYTTGYSGEAGFFRVLASPLKRSDHFGCSVVAGADLYSGAPARMGLNASYQFVNCSERFAADLHVFSLGVHALIGR